MPRSTDLALHRLRLKAADAGVHDPPLPEVIDVVQGHDVGDQRGQETGFVAFVVVLLKDLFSGGPALGPKSHGLREVLYGGRHGGLLQVSKLGGVSMGMVHEQMLEEEDGIEGRDQFDSHQVLVSCQVLSFLPGCGVSAQQLQERLLFLARLSLKIQLIDCTVFLLPRMWRPELLGELVCPRHLDVGQLEGYFRSQWMDTPQKRIGHLLACHVRAVEALYRRCLMHLCDIG